jgi:uncharacterized protein (DUF1330 family)
MNRFIFSCILAMAAAAAPIWNPARAEDAAQPQARRPATAAAYYISEFELTDPEGIRPYSAAVESTFRPYGGKYVVRGGRTVSLEAEPLKRIIMIEFPSLQQAQAWYDSPEYGAIRPIRHRTAKSRAFLMEGMAR